MDNWSRGAREEGKKCGARRSGDAVAGAPPLPWVKAREPRAEPAALPAD